MSESISDQLNEACRAAVMDEDLHIEHINISPQAFADLGRDSYIHCDNIYVDSPITWHSVELKIRPEMNGVTFELITTPNEVPAWGGSPKGRLPT
ncbi:hypothetical protein [uncultured Psychrobacter sp.]|uniref:hypothetical protein n=1 Tax=uncultured Psychrobacter sp. TaxID=259303 RepID=UPI000E8DF5AE|nr:hypothetical protein [Psychrobacter sp.]|tara:strand:- start:325 stop:609 length:285 start_codon:yes stop_codon:yes gene_type:complete